MTGENDQLAAAVSAVREAAAAVAQPGGIAKAPGLDTAIASAVGQIEGTRLTDADRDALRTVVLDKCRAWQAVRQKRQTPPDERDTPMVEIQDAQDLIAHADKLLAAL